MAANSAGAETALRPLPDAKEKQEGKFAEPSLLQEL